MDESAAIWCTLKLLYRGRLLPLAQPWYSVDQLSPESFAQILVVQVSRSGHRSLQPARNHAGFQQW